MKGIINFSLNNKFAVWLLTIMVVVAGLYAGLGMKQETIPDIEIPILTVFSVYPGASSEEVANSVTIPLEQRIRNLNGVEVVNSTSSENVSSIIVEYDYSVDMKEAETELRTALSGFVRPQGVQEANISAISINAFPVMSLSISGEGQSLEEMTKLVETEIKHNLEGIDGVGIVAIAGQQLKEVVLTFDQAKMASLGVSEDLVRGIIQGSALEVPLGLFELDQSEKSIIVDGDITSIQDLENIFIPMMPTSDVPNPGALQLKDIADIQLVERAESISRTNGIESIGINITKAADANTVEVVNAVKSQIDQIKKDYTGVEILVLLDQGAPIEESVSTMLNKAMFGAVFALIIILLFLRNIRTTIISIISIPLSLIMTLLVLKQMDITLNIMTLGAMTVAIGRVVDDSIVVIENNYRRMQMKSEKLKGKALILDATREMFKPILSSTLVTIAVFVPLGTVNGPIGEIFMPFALTMVFALLASLLVAITIVPMMTHLLFKNGVKTKGTHEEKPGALGIKYQQLLKWTLNHKFITSSIAVIVLVASLFLVPVVGTSFIPEEEQKYAMITYSPGPGELLSDVEQTALQSETLILARNGVTDLQYSVGGANPMSPGPSKSALFYVLYESDIEDFESEKESLIQALVEDSAAPGEWGTLDFSGGLGGNTLSLIVYGNTMEEIKPIVEQVVALVQADKSFEKVETSISKTYEQYKLVANQQALSQVGLTAGQIAMHLSPVRERPVLTEIQVDGNEYQVYVNVDQKQFESIEDIKGSMIATPVGIEVPLGNLVSVEEGITAGSVARKNGQLFAEVTANIVVSDVGKASADLESQVDKLDMPSTVNVEFGGITEQINETFTQLGLAMAAAVAIVYFLLVITFGGAITPLVILFSLPFIAIGSLFGLFVAGETISAPAMMGILMLIGIVVTNAIVLIDRVINKEKEGFTTRDALIEAAGTRLRPILMTALATIGALLPLALGFEGTNGSLISKGLGVTVIGGLLSSTVLTLVIVPIVYEFFAKFRKTKKREDDLSVEV